MRFIKYVAFFGYADCAEDSKLYQAAYQVSSRLAKLGLTVVDGGGPGVMQAATQGAKDNGSETISITFEPKDAPGFEGKYVKNITDREIKTGNYVERMFKLLEHGDVYIVFKGGTGTLSEFATAWCLARLYRGHHKPFILYGEFWQEVLDCFEKNFFMRGGEKKLYRIANSTDEVLSALNKFDEEFARRLGRISLSR